jgi:hypothetical protein
VKYIAQFEKTLYLYYIKRAAQLDKLREKIMNTTITPEINYHLNQIKTELAKRLVPGIRIRGEFVANTRQSNDYLAFVYLDGVEGLPNEAVTNNVGLQLSDLPDTQKCVNSLVNDISGQGLINSYIFK